MTTQALSMVLELTRVDDPQDPHAFRFEPQGYTFRAPGGALRRFDIPWTRELLDDIEELRRPRRDPAVIQRVGEILHNALSSVGWTRLGEQIRAASEAGRPVVVTLRSNAAELYVLPWELLTVGASGQHLGELPRVLLRQEWPATTTIAEDPSPRPEGGRVLFAWTAAGGAVPAAEHQRALASAWSEGHMDFDPAADILAHASAASIADALADAEKAGKPFAVLHFLCHGGRAGSIVGLVLDSGDGAASILDAERLRLLLAPHAKTLRLVVLASCDGGNAGDPGNYLASVAQTLHRAGIQSVIAPRYPLSVVGSIVLAETLYHSLLVGLHSLEHAFTDARAGLVRRTEHYDWASLQLYARAADGDDTRPIVFCPYRGLLVFEPRHRRFFFGRDAERRETLGDMQALIDGGKPRFLAVVGASGTGKSSMVLAGVVPEVERLKARHPGRWEVLRMLPGASPVATLDALLAGRPDKERPLLLVVDQFEEVFTQTPDVAMRAALIRQLWSLSRADTGVHVIVTLRVDFLGHCGDLVVDDAGLSLDRVAYDEAHRVFVARMAADQVRAAIEAPAARVGLTFASGLLERILADVGAEPGALPLLQYALTRLWQQRRGHMLAAEVYEEVGGLVGALEKDADDLIQHLDAEQRRHARRLLTQLVDTSDDETVDTRRRVELGQLEPADAARRTMFEAVLSRLVDSRLVVRSDEAGAPTLEIAHEALIRRWGVLRQWIGEDRVTLVEQEKLREWALDSDENKTLLTGTKLDRAVEFVRLHSEDIDEPVRRLVQASEAERRRLAAEREAQRRRRRKTVAAVISVLVAGVLGMTGLSLYALQQQTRAEELLETSKGITRELLVEVLPKYADIPGTADVQRELHERLKTMLRTLRADAEQDTEVVHLEIEQRIRRGALAMTHERLDEAREEFSQALTLAERFAGDHLDDDQAQRDLLKSLDQLGEVEVRAGNLAAARAHHDRSLKASEALAVADPTSAQAQHDLCAPLKGLGDVEVQVGNLAAARGHYERSLKVAEALTAADPTNAQAQRDVATSLERLGDVEAQAGTFAAARGHYDRAIKISEALAAADPTSAQAQRDLSVVLNKPGDVEVQAGNLAVARGHYERSLKVCEALAAADPKDTQAQRDLVVSLDKLGYVEVMASNLAAARGHSERSLKLCEALAAADPTSARAQRDLSISLHRLGDVEKQVGNLAAAARHYDRSLKVLEVLAAADPTSAQTQRHLSVSLDNLGYLEMQAGNLAAARGLFDRALKVVEALAAADPTSAQPQRDLSVALDNLGYLEVQAGNLAAARGFFDRSLKVCEALAGADPTSAQPQRYLSVSLNNLGYVEVQLGDLAAARSLFDRSLKVREALAEADPTSAQAQRDVSIPLINLGDMEVQAGNLATAREHYERALALMDPFVKTIPDDSDASFQLVQLYLSFLDLARKEKHPEAQKQHAEAALALLESMDARGQVRGFVDREEAMKRLKHELASLRKARP